jgi:hypothetical protein
VFDPELDEDHDTRRFYVRLLALVAVSVVGCVSLYPSVTSFPAGVDQKGCLAIVDGWHADRRAPTAADRTVEATAGPYSRSSAAEQRILDRVYAYDDWRVGSGACIPESRHRLIMSGIGLAAIATVIVGIAIGRSLRLRARST